MNTLSLLHSIFHHLLRPVVWLPAAALMAAGLATTAFASDDPGLAAIGGEGTGGISGYQVTDIHYEFDQGNPGLFHAVTLSVIGADGQTKPTTVSVTLGAGQPASTCGPIGGNVWTCPVSFPVADAAALRVLATR
jgi:hypothetical protein